jgi:hypothetical protein
MRAINHVVIALAIAVLLSPLFPLLAFARDNINSAPP